MKKAIAIFVTLTAMLQSVQAATRGTVVLPLQVVKTDGFTLPSKTDYLEIKKVKISTDAALNGFGAALNEKLKEIDDNGAEHYVYALVARPAEDQSGQIRVDVYDSDILKGNELSRRMIFGDIQVGRAHFVVLMNPDNADFLKKYVKNAGGNTRFERVYEFVAEVLPKQHTTMHATWDGSKLNVTTYILDGEDLLNSNTSAQAGEPGEEYVSIPLITLESEASKAATIDTTGNHIADNEFMLNPTSGLRLKQLSISEEVAGMKVVTAAIDKLKAIAQAEKEYNTLLLTVDMRGGYPTGFEVNSGDVIKLSSSMQYAGVIKIGGINFVLTTTPLTAPTIDQAVEDAGPTICFSHALKVVKQRPIVRNTAVKCDWTNGAYKVTRAVVDGRHTNLEP